MNGGTTFLTRICRRMNAKGARPAVLVMFKDMDPELHAELKKHASVFYLWDYIPQYGKILPSRLQTFGPINWRRLCADLAEHSADIHAMGVFGLVFAQRLSAKVSSPPTLTVGIYHQNEFLYDTHGRRFPREMQRLFCDIPSKNVVFFNDGTKRSYERFFSKDYSDAPIVPIGIEIQLSEPVAKRTPLLIVSVGNLVDFKTYNEHIIRLVASLHTQFPDISYHIYGAGPNHDRLERVISELGLGDQVQLKGVIPYSDFSDVVGKASIFVGSGTALLEAASLGVPALIGIESIQQPLTYGFLCDVPGLSYNEYIEEYKKVEMQTCVIQVLSDSQEAEKIGQECKKKAREFSIEETVYGLTRLSGRHFALPRLTFRKLFLIALFLVETVVHEKITKGPNFADRRNQSFLPDSTK